MSRTSLAPIMEQARIPLNNEVRTPRAAWAKFILPFLSGFSTGYARFTQLGECDILSLGHA